MDPAVLYFLPWMRRGLASAATGGTDQDGVPNAGPASVAATVSLHGQSVSRDVQLQGPGAVVGVNPAQVLRCFPPPDTVDFGTNDFVHLELRTADLPWMFAPGAPTADRLMPWLALVVVEEREGVEYAAGAPLPVLLVDDADVELPPLRQACAWVHVQCTADPAPGIDRVFQSNPEAFAARLLAPRRLRGGIWYRACLVPSFRAGRDAGLGLTFESGDVGLAWEAGARDLRLPVYFSWRFRTTTESEDFQSLVSRLKACTLPGDVGQHALDLGTPGSGALPRRPGVSTSYLGAFLSPRLRDANWPPAHKQAFQEGLRHMLNQGVAEPAKADGATYDPLRDDPVVAPPLYGALAAGAGPIARGARGWLADANLDPANRVVTGLGAEIVRRLQETLMAEAWNQAAAVREANAILNRTRLALEVGKRLAARMAKLDDGQWLQWSRGAHPRLRLGDAHKMLHGALLDSAVPRGVVSAAFRCRCRVGTTIGRAYAGSSAGAGRSLAGALTVDFVDAPRRTLDYARITMPPGTVMVERISPQAGTAGQRSTKAPAGPATTEQASPIRRSLSPRPITRSVQNRTAGSALPDVSVVKGEQIGRVVSSIPVGQGTGGAVLRSTIRSARQAMDPAKLLAARIREIIRTATPLGKEPVPASLRIDPEISRPLYSDLARLDPGLIMPGVDGLPMDSVALARVNTAFVEAFLLGANDELRSEFLWREFPASPGGTWLRTFWDAVSEDGGAAADQAEDRADDTEADIVAVADWKPASALGSHCTLDPDRTLVLIVKGELLQRYPDTVIYATPAVWSRDDDGNWERLEDLQGSPVYPSVAGKLAPAVTFVGLEFPPDVVIDADLVGSSQPPGGQGAASPAGWFFALEQLTEEPHFGLDLGNERQAGRVPARWENLSWAHVMGEPETAYVDLSTLSTNNGGRAPTLAYDERGWNSDWKETWAENSAAMARITWQRPVRMLVHADQMLRSGPDGKEG